MTTMAASGTCQVPGRLAMTSAHETGALSGSGASGVRGPASTVEFGNADVTVLRIRIAPHERLPMHDVTPRVIIWLTDAHLRMTFPEGPSQEFRSKAGETTWLPAGRHAGENLSHLPIEFVAVLPKSRAPLSGPGS